MTRKNSSTGPAPMLRADQIRNFSTPRIPSSAAATMVKMQANATITIFDRS